MRAGVSAIPSSGIMPCRKIRLTVVEIDILSSSFLYINTASGTLSHEATHLIRTIEIIVLVVSFIQACSNLCTNGFTGRNVVNLEIIRSAHQLEEIILISKLQIVISGKLIIIFVYITITDRHEI